MKYYINSISTDKTLQRDMKEYIPDMTLRRRMSRVVKMGVTTAMDCLMKFTGDVDAIITATGLGCIADSEKFLANMIGNHEQMLNPTPFIQSTFNTVGAQVALLCKNHNYNMTYTHGGLSFESALLDAMLRIDEGVSKAVLVGSVDETTPNQHRIMERMGFYRGRKGGEGSVFFVLTAQARHQSVAVVEDIDFLNEVPTAELPYGKYGQKVVFMEDMAQGVYHTAVAEALAEVVAEVVKVKKETVLINNYGGKNLSAITVRPI